MHLVTRPALKRIGAAFLALAIVAGWGYFDMLRMPGKSARLPIFPATPEQIRMAKTLRADVDALASSIGERNTEHPQALERGARYVEDSLKSAGYTTARQPYAASGIECSNVEAETPGKARPSEIVLIGAHYDSVEGTRGADDNASGVAVLLELARALAGAPLERTVRFVAFVNEEPPHFWTGEMGSVVYAKRSRVRGEQIVAMLSLETIGYYDDRAGTQHYPPPLNLFYPSSGNFVGFVGNRASRGLVRRVVQLFRDSADVPSEGAALPSWLEGVGWSDQWSFWQEGYPGVMVTDTAPFRNPNYHRASDLPETLNYDRMARVATGLAVVVRALAGSD